MPVLTRNQKAEKLFSNTLYNLFHKIDNEKDLTNKMNISLEIMKYTNKNLPNLVYGNSNKWGILVYSVINKVYEFEVDYSLGLWNEIDNNLVDIFRKELDNSKQMCLNLIEKYKIVNNRILKYNELIEEELKLRNSRKEELKSKENSGVEIMEKKLRNICRVNYAGMC